MMGAYGKNNICKKELGNFARMVVGIRKVISFIIIFSITLSIMPVFAMSNNPNENIGVLENDKLNDTIEYTTDGGIRITNESIWVLENDRLSATIEHTTGSGIKITSLYNKVAEVEYLPENEMNQSVLFDYTYRLLEENETGTESLDEAEIQTITSNDKDFTLGDVVQSNITYKATDGNSYETGRRLEIPLTSEDENLTITLKFDIYNDNGGLRYQAFIKNNNVKKLQIIESDVISLDMPDKPRNLHYSYVANWHSTIGGVDYTNCAKESEDIKVIINLYDDGHGFYLEPEVNGKTQVYKRDPLQSGQTQKHMDKAIAGIRAFNDPTKMVKVSTNPDSFKLVLFPNEEFEYIAVNMTTFAGDIVDGKMAAEEHLRLRYSYNDTATIMNTNDWGWRNSGDRHEAYYRETAVPKAKEAGLDMIMFDDLWNTDDYMGPGSARDSVEPDPNITEDLKGLSQHFIDEGFSFGLWYSMSGGYHNGGNDLADPAVISAKKSMIEWMIDNYSFSHQMIDLTEFWLNDEVTTYSHPTDNVYRKNVLTKNVLNEIVDKYPDYKVKYTTEVDIYPSQGDRTNELLHVINNGWTTDSTATVTGEIATLPVFASVFGHLPLDSIYFNDGDMKTGDMEEYYGYLFARNVKHGMNPKDWTQSNIDLMRKFNDWRKSDRIAELTKEIKRPVYIGAGWDNKDASKWDQDNGPYAFVQVAEDERSALLIATGGRRNGKTVFNADIRWLNPTKSYLVEDITLDDSGEFQYRFKGIFDYAQLRAFEIDLNENNSKGKAFWIEEYTGEDYQVLYAEPNVDTSNINFENDIINVSATGEANETGNIIVYGKDDNGVMVINLEFDGNGEAQFSDEFITTEDDFIPAPPSELEYNAAELHKSGKTVVKNWEVRLVDGGNTENVSREILLLEPPSGFQGLGHIDFTIDVEKPGVYDIKAFAKVNSSRGLAQWYIDGNKAGEVWNQGTTPERVESWDLGIHEFNTAGEKVFRIEYLSGGERLCIDRLVLSPVIALGEPMMDILGESTVEKGNQLHLQAKISGLHPIYSTGDYVKWIIESQEGLNGKKKVVSILQNGLECILTGVNEGTARLKAVSTADDRAVGLIDITVKSRILNIDKVEIEGDPINQATITAKVHLKDGGIGMDTEAFKYQWLRDGMKIEDAKKLSYQLQANDIGKSLSVLVTPAYADGTKGESVESNRVVGKYNDTIVPVINSISFTAIMGQATDLSYMYFDGNNFKEGNTIITYTLDGKNISSPYEFLEEDIGKTVVVTIIPVNDNNISGIPVIKTTTVIPAADSLPVVLSVNPNSTEQVVQVGETLVATYDYRDANNKDEGDTLVQWYMSDSELGSDKVVIDEAVSLSFKITKETRNKYLFIEISPVNIDGVLGELVTAPVVSVVKHNPNFKPTMTIEKVWAVIGKPAGFEYKFEDENGFKEEKSTIEWIVNGISQGDSFYPSEEDIGLTVTLLVIPRNEIGIEGRRVEKNIIVESAGSKPKPSEPSNPSSSKPKPKPEVDLGKENEKPIETNNLYPGFSKTEVLIGVNNIGLNKRSGVSFISGYEDKTFRPEKGISREEALAMIYNLVVNADKADVDKKDNFFDDVSRERYSYNAITYFANKSVVAGTAKRTFSPGKPMTRGEFSKIIAGFIVSDPNAVIDIKDARGHWAETHIKALVSNGLMVGFEDGTFRPNKEITRSEIVVIICRLLGRTNVEGNQSITTSFIDIDKSHWAYNFIVESSK